jgi:hypothetical protein
MALRARIAGYPIKIIATKPTLEYARGECEFHDDESMVIRIDPDLKDHAFIEVLFHEMIEAANGVFDLELPHPTIQTLGVAMAQCFPKALIPAVRKALKAR